VAGVVQVIQGELICDFAILRFCGRRSPFPCDFEIAQNHAKPELSDLGMQPDFNRRKCASLKKRIDNVDSEHYIISTRVFDLLLRTDRDIHNCLQ
jgi:hypothetical protein